MIKSDNKNFCNVVMCLFQISAVLLNIHQNPEKNVLQFTEKY